MKDTTKGMLFALAGNLIFGFSYYFSKSAMAVASPILLLAYRFLLAFGVMALLRLFGILKTDFKSKKKHLPRLFLMGLFQPVLYFLCETYGLSLCSSTFTSVMMALVPVLCIFFAFFFLKEKVRPLQVFFCVLAVGGVVAMAFLSKNEGDISPLGVILMVAACGTVVGFNLLSRRLSTVFTAVERTFCMLGMSAVAFTLLAVLLNLGDLSLLIAPLSSQGFWFGIFYLGFFSSVLAFFCVNSANSYLPLARAGAFSNVITVVSTLSGILLLKEDYPLVPSLLLCLLVVAGVWGAQHFAPCNQD